MKFLIVLAAALSISAAGIIPPMALPVPLANVYEPQRGIEGRITNGHTADNDQFPYQAGLSLKTSILSSAWCGGSLISNAWVLTAAHCTDGVQSVTVFLGSTVRASPEVSHTVDRSSIIQHDGYNHITLANDVSLIKIPDVAYSSSIQAVRLPTHASSNSTYADSYAIASGWGRTSDDSTVAKNLNYARMQIIANDDCTAIYGDKIVTSSVLCVSTPNGVSICKGDSGGPLVLEDERILVGVASFVSIDGCAAGSPSGFVRVSSFLPWIKQYSEVSY